MTARPATVCTLVFLSALLPLRAHSQCEVKVYQDMLMVSAGPGCLSESGGKQAIAAGVKNVVQELNEDSAAPARERHLSARDKLYRLAEMQNRERVSNELRVQNELRQNNRFLRP